VRSVRAGAAIAALGVVVATSGAGAADEPRPVRYRDGTILTLDPATGRTRWIAKPKRGEYLDLATVGRSLVVGMSGPCGGDGLERMHPVGLDPRTGEQRWRARVEGGVSAPGTGRNRVIVSGSDGGIFGLDVATGRRRWRIPTVDVIGATNTYVFVDEGRGSDAEQVVTHDRKNGKERWTFRFPRDVGETGPLGAAVTLVAANRDLVVVARGGFNVRYGSSTGTEAPGGPTNLFALDARTGRALHRMVLADPDLTASRGVLRRGTLALIDGAAVTGIDLDAGTVRWRHPIAPRPDDVPGSFTFGPRGALSSAANGRVSIYSDRNRRTVAALDTVTGRALWSRTDIAMVGTGAARSIVLLAPLRTYTSEPLEGVDVTTGRTRWTRTLRSTYAVPEPQLLRRGLAPMAVTCGTP
jgi:outer membrane protein assembly factor BamB